MIAMFRLSAWLLAAAVTFATLGPPQFRPHSNLGQDGEHTLAFILVGFLSIRPDSLVRLNVHSPYEG